MFAIAFDLDYLATAAAHPKSVRQAYRDLAAMTALMALGWFSSCVKDVRAFRVENWSNFNAFFKGSNR